MIRMILSVAALLIILPISMLHAQEYEHGINVTGINGLDLGKMLLQPGGELVAFNSPSDARFTVQGQPGRAVRLMVTAPAPNQHGSGLAVAINAADCRYSVDEGRTWQPFASGLLLQDTRFSDNGMSDISTIHVHIGGALRTSGIARAKRGAFVGSLRLSATYLDADQDFME